MPGPLVKIRNQAVLSIAALTPDDETQIPFRETPQSVPLEDMPLSSSPSENTRRFEVNCGHDPRFSGWNGGLGMVVQSIVVRVLYHVPQGTRREGHKRLMNLTGSDAARIAHELNQPPASGGGDYSSTARENMILNGDPVLTERDDDGDDTFILELRFATHYNLGR